MKIFGSPEVHSVDEMFIICTFILWLALEGTVSQNFWITPTESLFCINIMLILSVRKTMNPQTTKTRTVLIIQLYFLY